MFTKDSRILNHRLTVPLTSVSKAVGGVFTPTPSTVPEPEPDPFTPLFANNEQGFFYDPNDLSTMFQDSAGTVPVTGAGQPVGRILDKSGNNNHAIQYNSASRPILRQNATTDVYYLEFDGSDDYLISGSSINFTATDKLSLFVGIRKLGIFGASLCELSSNASAWNGTFMLLAPNIADSYGWRAAGTSSSVTNATGYASPHSAVISATLDIAQSMSTLSVNGSKSVNNASLGSGKLINQNLFIGIRGAMSLPFNGHVYSLIGIGRLATAIETETIENELAERVGVTLSV